MTTENTAEPSRPAEADPVEKRQRRTDPLSGTVSEWTGRTWRVVTRAELDREAWKASR